MTSWNGTPYQSYSQSQGRANGEEVAGYGVYHDILGVLEAARTAIGRILAYIAGVRRKLEYQTGVSFFFFKKKKKQNRLIVLTFQLEVTTTLTRHLPVTLDLPSLALVAF